MKNNKLLQNTIMLYILTFSNYFFSFITIPYQTRVLGPSHFGQLNFAAAFITYIQVLIDFGFVLSGTEMVAKHKYDTRMLCRIYTSITVAKLLLIAVSGLFLLGSIFFSAKIRDAALIVLLYYFSACAMGLFPDYLYRGMEEMRSITVRSVCIKLFFTLNIFIVVRNASDYYWIPLLTFLGNVAAMFVTVLHIKKIFHVTWVRVEWREIMEVFRSSSFFFYSRIATTIYSATNTFLMGILYGTAAPIVGLFSSANKLIGTGKQAFTPIVDSLYPYMVLKKDFQTIKKLLCVLMPLITIGCMISFIFAQPICIFLFGVEYEGAAFYLRLLIPTLWCSFPAMLFGFPIMSPLGLSRYVNLSNIIGAVVQISLLAVCFIFDRLNVVSICIVTCLTELVTLIYRIGVVYWYGKRQKEV